MRTLITYLLLAASISSVWASESLTLNGSVLEDLSIDIKNANIVKQVDLNGDVVLSTYLLLYFPDIGIFQRVKSAGFQPWNGQADTLENAGMTVSNGQVQFDIYQGPLTTDLLPITVCIAYLTDSGLKYGMFNVNASEVPDSGPSSFDLIDMALKNGALTATEAHHLNLLAGYEPDRLPAEFRGETSRPRSNLQKTVKWLAKNWDLLNEETQTALLPYYVMPDDPQSYANQINTRKKPLQLTPRRSTRCDASLPWQYRIATIPGNPDTIPAIPARDARIHYRQGDAASLQQAEWIGDAFIQAYHNFAELFGIELDEDVYVYLEVISDYGLERLREIDGAERSVITIRCGLDEPLTKSVTAHELFHAFQEMYDMEYDTDEQVWLAETTAVWSENYVYPEANAEHRFLDDFFEDLDQKMISQAGYREYHTYPWFLFLTQWLGNNHLIKDIWEKQDGDNIREIVMDEDYFDVAFHEFARWNWNMDPVAQYHDPPEFPGNPTMGQAYQDFFILPDDQETAPVIMEGLSMFYYAILIDTMVDRVAIRFEGEGNPTHRRQALIRVGDAWHREDWTPLTERVFCRSWEHERVDAIVLIYSNSSWDDIISENFEIDATGFCEAQWRGRAKVTGIYEFSEAGTELTLSGDYTVHTKRSRWEITLDEVLTQDEEDYFKVETQFATYEKDYLEETDFHRQCSLMWEKERENTWGSLHMDYREQDYQPTRLKPVYGEDDAFLGLLLNISAGAEYDWITRREQKEQFNQSCLFAWKSTYGVSDRIYYDNKASYKDSIPIEMDELPEIDFSGTLTIPMDLPCDRCYVIVEYDYAYR